MPCSSCGQRRAAVGEAQAQAAAAGYAQARYYVADPSTGEVVEFTDYVEATTYKRRTNGTLTTTSG